MKFQILLAYLHRAHVFGKGRLVEKKNASLKVLFENVDNWTCFCIIIVDVSLDEMIVCTLHYFS